MTLASTVGLAFDHEAILAAGLDRPRANLNLSTTRNTLLTPTGGPQPNAGADETVRRDGARDHRLRGRPGAQRLLGRGEIRIHFDFDPIRRAVLLVAGHKSGTGAGGPTLPRKFGALVGLSHPASSPGPNLTASTSSWYIDGEWLTRVPGQR